MGEALKLKASEDIEAGRMRRAIVVCETLSGDLYMEITSSQIDSLGLVEWAKICLTENIGAQIQNRGTYKPKLPPPTDFNN